MSLKREYTTKEYRELDAIHYSQLSSLAFSPQNLLSEEREFSEGMKFGSLIDCLVTHPEDFNDEFKVLTASKPTGQMLEFCDTLFKNKCSKEEAYIIVGFKRDKLDKVIERFEVEGKAYLEELQQSEGKTPITLEEYELGHTIKNNIINGEFTKDYFDTSKYEILYQFPILVEIDHYGVKIKLKCLFDILCIDHKSKSIIPIDLKTTSNSVYSFKSDFMKWHYYLQSALYQHCLSEFITDTDLFNYYVEPFRFIVASNNPNNPVLVFMTIPNDIVLGLEGCTKQNGHRVKGVFDLIEELSWHKKNNYYNVPKEIFDTKGHISINMETYVQ